MLGIFLSLVAGIFSSLLSQPFLVERNVNIVFIGYIFSVVLLIQAIGSMFAHRIEAFLKENLNSLSRVFYSRHRVYFNVILYRGCSYDIFSLLPIISTMDSNTR